jgi:hypothetical protein
MSGLKEAAARPASFMQTMRAVAWSFLGIRKRAGFEQDVQKLNPVHVVVAGVLGAVIFVVTLIVVVRWVISSGLGAV